MTNTNPAPIERADARTTFEIVKTANRLVGRQSFEARWVRDDQRGPWLRITAQKFSSMKRSGVTVVTSR